MTTPVVVNDWYRIASLNGSQIKAALVTGPVVVTVNASCTSFQNYDDGIYTGTTTAGSVCDTSIYYGEGLAYHPVLLVGYDTDEDTKQEYFILKNSHGTDWG